MGPGHFSVCFSEGIPRKKPPPPSPIPSLPHVFKHQPWFFLWENQKPWQYIRQWKDPVHGLELWPCSCDLHNHNSKVSVNAQWTTPGSFITSFDILSKSPLIQRRRETRVTRAQCLMVLITEERTCRDGESSRHSCGGHPWSHFYLFQLILQPTNMLTDWFQFSFLNLHSLEPWPLGYRVVL